MPTFCPHFRVNKSLMATTPTPGARTAMRRADRAVEVMARRTPWILRGMARLAPVTGRR